LAVPTLDDYPVIKVRWEGHWIDGHRALISARECRAHFGIVGPGKISGNPGAGRTGNAPAAGPHRADHLPGCAAGGFATEHQKMWSIHPTYCNQVTAKNLFIRSTGGNGDGIDVDSCTHVRIEDCDISTGDDCIAIKSGRGMEGYRLARPTEDVLIRNCTFADSLFACIGIGSETSGGIRGVRIEHCKFTYAKSYALYIKSNTGRGAFIGDISARDLDVATAPGGGASRHCPRSAAVSRERDQPQRLLPDEKAGIDPESRNDSTAAAGAPRTQPRSGQSAIGAVLRFYGCRRWVRRNG
jgi:polygalacturonase